VRVSLVMRSAVVRIGLVLALAAAGGAAWLVWSGARAKSRAEQVRQVLHVGMTRAEVLSSVSGLTSHTYDCVPPMAGKICATLTLEFANGPYGYLLTLHFGSDDLVERVDPVTPRTG
jgi:hypothetical protein